MTKCQHLTSGFAQRGGGSSLQKRYYKFESDYPAELLLSAPLRKAAFSIYADKVNDIYLNINNIIKYFKNFK